MELSNSLTASNPHGEEAREPVSNHEAPTVSSSSFETLGYRQADRPSAVTAAA